MLMPHQKTGVEWLVRNTANGLFDEMGLGKTVTTICAADALGADRMLVVAPSAVAFNWRREMQRWSPRRRVQVVTHGRAKLHRDRTQIVTHGLLLSRAIHEQLVAQHFDLVVLDECHFFRTPGAKRTRIFYGDRERRFEPIVDATEACWVLTGTPMPNDPSELWTMVHALAPERIDHMDYAQFRSRFCQLAPSDYRPDGRVVGALRVPELRDRLKGFGLRRLKRDHLDLPKVRYGTVALTASRSATELLKFERSIPREVLRLPPEELLAWLRENEEFARWRRLCALAKVDSVCDLLRSDLRSGMRKCVVVAHHRDVIEAIRQGCGARSIEITGGVSGSKRTRLVEQFQTDPGVRLAFVNIVAGGVGITLTAASEVLVVEQSFVPGENAQAIDRVDRIGQVNPVQVRYVSLANSIDEIVTEILARKTETIREVME